MFPGAGCLNGGIQSQQIGLLADLLNHADHLANFFRTMRQRTHLLRDGSGSRRNFLHRCGRGMHHGPALFGVSADERLDPAALSALWLISLMVAVIS